jgi:hypothetical protein
LGKRCPKPVKVDPKTTIAGTPKKCTMTNDSILHAQQHWQYNNIETG